MSKLLDSVGLAEFGKQFLARLNNIFVNKSDSENFTTVEKNKLSGIESGAKANVQSDWNVTDSTSDAYISNKPTIPTDSVVSQWGYIKTETEFLNSAASVIEARDLQYWNDKQDALTFDSAPTSGSTNPVTSGGVYTAVSSMATLASPAFTGTPTSTTPTAGDDSTKIATTEFVNDAIDTAITNAGIPSSSTITSLDTRVSAVENALNSVTGAYVYKGSCTYANLPSSGQAIGDVWNVTDAHDSVPAGTNYAWNGTVWDALAGSFSIDTMTNNDITGAITEIFDEE